MKYENDVTFHCIREYGWQRVRGGDYTLIDEKQHLLSLIFDSGLGNEVCPVKVADGINVPELGYKGFTLALEDGKYFVGTTRHVNLAILSETNGKGAEWTRLFKPKELIRLVPLKADNVEGIADLHEQELKRAMLEHGYQNVRGGSFKLIHPESHRRMVYEAFGINDDKK